MSVKGCFPLEDRLTQPLKRTLVSNTTKSEEAEMSKMAFP